MLGDHSGELMLRLLVAKKVIRTECPKSGKFGFKETVLRKYEDTESWEER